jgi:serine/threonine protein kinase
MENISTTLHETVKSVQLSYELYIEIAIGLARGLSYLHSHPNKILHKNFNSRNIKVDLSGARLRVKITGFDLAQVNTNSITPANQMLVALAYTAPELLENKPYTENADIYSFGIMIWEMISRKNAVPNLMNGNGQAIFDQFPAAFENLIKLCCDKNPGARPKSQDIINYLENIKQTNTASPVAANYSNHNHSFAQSQALYSQAKAAELNKNYQLAFNLYQQAANIGNIDAIANVGSYLVQGLGGIPIDKVTGKKHLVDAAQKGQPRAQYNLAQMLEFGDGCAQDLQEANYWYALAANQSFDPKVATKARERLTIFKLKK